MHMGDALVSVPVAVCADIVAATLIIIAARNCKFSSSNKILPIAGVIGAFILAAQFINFSIPGTGSSGHIIGGILLAALIGPWAAFITLSAVIILQCLLFADGGLLAVGCNIINMAAVSCLIAYPLIYQTITRKSFSNTGIMCASIFASILALELGALLVIAETSLSGVSALPPSKFVLFMLPIHFIIAVCEGVATGALLIFVANYNPDLIYSKKYDMSKRTMVVIALFAALAILFAATIPWISSSNPDGLEWSIENTKYLSTIV